MFAHSLCMLPWICAFFGHFVGTSGLQALYGIMVGQWSYPTLGLSNEKHQDRHNNMQKRNIFGLQGLDNVPTGRTRIHTACNVFGRNSVECQRKFSDV